MVASTKSSAQLVEIEPNYDRLSELKAFDDTKTGVKGVVDAGITAVPNIFLHHPPENSPQPLPPQVTHFRLPVIDLAGASADPGRRAAVVAAVREASEAWGFFQVVNHGVEERVMEEMMGGVRRFNEQDGEERKKWYTRDLTRDFVYCSNFDLFSGPETNWKDTFFCKMAPRAPNPQNLPTPCSPQRERGRDRPTTATGFRQTHIERGPTTLAGHVVSLNPGIGFVDFEMNLVWICGRVAGDGR